MITITASEFYTNRTWEKPLDWQYFPGNTNSLVELFDQNGYRLTDIEQSYAKANGQLFVEHGHEKSIRKPWMFYEQKDTGAHLNHAFLFERKGYSGAALEQLKDEAKYFHLLNKLVNYKGKWGIDFSMDYVDESGNSMEIVHFEYDSYDLDEILSVKDFTENAIKKVDWEHAAKILIKDKADWINLEFFAQSKWKTDYFGLPAERFKMNAWE
jgi:hypothetical protein